MKCEFLKAAPSRFLFSNICLCGSATRPLASLDAKHADVLSKYVELPKHSCGRQAYR